jgi:hypothetical protein
VTIRLDSPDLRFKNAGQDELFVRICGCAQISFSIGILSSNVQYNVRNTKPHLLHRCCARKRRCHHHR